MARTLFLIMLLTECLVLSGQIPVTIEGTVVNNTITGTWAGVNIQRSVPTALTYRNNSITSVNSAGYMLQAGDETPLLTNNNLDGEIITGNKFQWNGPVSNTIITHGLFAGYNKNSVVKYNYMENVPYGIIFKSGSDQGVNMTFTSGGCAYNICKNGKFAGRVKGVNGVAFYNNTFYSGDGKGWYLLFISENMDRPVPAPSTGIKVFNNIFYSTIQIPMIKTESASLTGFECDYNVYWCTAGEPIFNIDGINVTWSQWRARGYDSHSVIMDPRFNNTSDFVPAARLDYGKNLGAEWQAGLALTASWTPGISPASTNQNGNWQVGARIYDTQTIPVTGITITGAGGANTITTDDGTLQLGAELLPANASNKTIRWSITSGTGQASITDYGLVKAIDNGTVTAVAAATDGSGVLGYYVITISNQVIPVGSIAVSGAGGAYNITTDNGTLQMNALVLPVNATNKSVTWSLSNLTGQASVDQSGLLRAIENGTVQVTATAADGSGISGTVVITISNQVTPVSSITVTSQNGLTAISTMRGTLQLIAAVLPSNATNKAVSWSVTGITGRALINSSGLITAVDNGTVEAKATSTDGTNISGSILITISNQLTPVLSITISGAGGSNSISVNKGTLQLSALVLPADAVDKSISWSIVNNSGVASVSQGGLVTAIADGVATAVATANDGSGVVSQFPVYITNQVNPVTAINVKPVNGLNTISTDDGTLQLVAELVPAYATVRTVTWSVLPGTGKATINQNGGVTAVENGTVTAKATATDGTGVSGSMVITITNQIVSVQSITVTGAGGLTSIAVDNGTLQLVAIVYPDNTSIKTVSWSVVNGTGKATISPSGLVTAAENGTVTAVAKANDGSGITGTLAITISNQLIPVTRITVTAPNGSHVISENAGTLQLQAIADPANATDKSVTWAITNGAGFASISQQGVLTAARNGTVTVTASAKDGSGISGIYTVNIVNQLVPVNQIVISGENNLAEISNGTHYLQLNAEILPQDASDKTVIWTVENGTGKAAINSKGLMQALENGVVTAFATANDGSGVSGSLQVTISTEFGEQGTGEENVLISATTGELKIYFPANDARWDIGLYDFGGTLGLKGVLEGSTAVLNVSALHTGIWLVVLSRGDKILVYKIFKP